MTRFEIFHVLDIIPRCVVVSFMQVLFMHIVAWILFVCFGLAFL